MDSDLNLVADLALIFISAGIITLIFKWLKQPLILGYIVVGFLIGPHFGLFPNITSIDAVKQWSEIGIIFLLFALGLEFSFKKLMQVGSTALITSGTIFIGMFCLGMLVGKSMGWSNMESIFLGGMLSMSSTTIIIKAFDDLGLKGKSFTGIVFGTLVVEDLLAILLMVLLSTLAVSQQFAGKEMIMGLLKLGFFLILWFLIGIYVIPTFLRRAHNILNDEVILILSVGLCFGMVVIAGYFGFSSALGAFVMGSILAETIESERIEKSIVSIKNLFGAIFFVSVGMMVDPAIIVQYWKPILILICVVLVGITFFATSGVLISGQPLSVAVRCGFSMPQIGEFAFIIAGLGVSLGVMRSFIYPVVVAVSVITTFTTPYFIRLADPVTIWLYKHLPKKTLDRIDANEKASHGITPKSTWKKLIGKYISRVIIYSVLLFAITFSGYKYLYPFLANNIFSELSISLTATKWICLIITIAVMSPFLYGLAVNSGNLSEDYQKLWSGRRSNRGILVALILLRVIIAVIFFISVFFQYFTISWWVIIALAICAGAFFIIARKSFNKFEFLETRFKQNYNEKEELEKQRLPITTSVKSKLMGHDIQVENITVSPNSKYIGLSLRNIPFRSEYGINIVKIVRGNKIINIPSADEFVYPFDKILCIGTESQIKRFMEVMEEDSSVKPDESNTNVTLESYTLTATSYLTGKSLIKAGMRNSGCMIIGVERDGKSIMNPDPTYVFAEGDTVWMVGESAVCKWYM